MIPSRYIPFALPLFAAITACNPDQPTGSDPLLPFGVRKVVSVGDYAYAGVIFQTERSRTNGVEGIVAVNLRSLFLEHRPLSNERIQSGDPAEQNVFIWETGTTSIVGKLGNELVGVNYSGQDGTGGIEVQLFDLADPSSPTVSKSAAIPDSTGNFVDHTDILDDSTIALQLSGTPASRVVIVRPGAGNDSRILSDTRFEEGGCSALKTRGTRAYCIHTTGEFPITHPNIRVYEYSTTTGLGALVQTVTAVDLFLAPDAYFALDGSLHVVDRGAGDNIDSGILVFDVMSSGDLAVRGKISMPLAGDSLAVPVSGTSVTDSSILVGTLDGAYLMNTVSATALSSNLEAGGGAVSPAHGLGAGYFIGGISTSGVTLYRTEGASLSRVGTYYRSWGDNFPNYGTIREGTF